MEQPEEREQVYMIYNFDAAQLDSSFVQKHCACTVPSEDRSYTALQPVDITVDTATFVIAETAHLVSVARRDTILAVSCTCTETKAKLCTHGAQVLVNIAARESLLIFFDDQLRVQKMKQFAVAYGLQQEAFPDRFFKVEYHSGKAEIKPRSPELFPITADSTRYLQQQLLAAGTTPGLLRIKPDEKEVVAVVLRQHRYYRHLVVELYKSEMTKAGKLKNPMQAVNPLDYLWRTDHAQEVKFFTGLSRFLNQAKDSEAATDFNALRAIVKNPAGYPFYRHNSEAGDNVTASSVEPVTIGELIHHITVVVDKKGNFYELALQVTIEGHALDFKVLPMQFDAFIVVANTYYLPATYQLLKLLLFFKQHHYCLMLHESKFPAFQREILEQLEDAVSVFYTYMKPATREQLQEQGMDKPYEKMIYLSESENYVLVNPVMRYGEVEIAIRTKKQIYAADNKGHLFTVQRDDAAELAFTALLIKQHPDFFEQVDNELTWFYLHKSQFLQEEWFLNVFEHWRAEGITIYGFNDLQNNRLNPYKVNIQIHVLSGANWFNANIEAVFGKRKASLKKLHKAVKNKSRYVELDDGTLGILPEAWMHKMAEYFNAGEIDGEILTIPKICFSAVNQLFDESMLDAEVQEELKNYALRFARFESIEEIPVPEALQGTLRHYQWQGLNWLNFLDSFNFGGCLADDMGLGKSIQLIAFILSQREKVTNNTNLIVVPASLVFNWREELEKFAPSVKLYIHHGTDRETDSSTFAAYEVVITTYSTLVSDIKCLKSFTFNYVIADESQNIKNAESQRYKAMCLLQCRNRIAVSGTPVENNTFDLYGQLSFACPGLLGGKQYFRDIFAIPIDRFKDNKRAAALQNIINPFLLRRSKQQVATELPEKTEMVVYCPMGPEQRKAYDASEKELRDYIEGKDDDDMPKAAMYVLKGITRLRQICNSPALLPEDNLWGNASSKIEILTQQLKEKTGRHKVLVFSQFVSMLELIKTELEKENIAFSYLTGSTVNREAVVNEFREKEEIRVFLISLKAGGTGLNLTEADYVYLVDPWWNPAVEDQAIDRSYRIGQKKKVIAIRLICPDTVEEKIQKLQATKKELVGDLVKTDASYFKELGKKDLLALLS
ncbi:hypothetical protein GCM10011379_25330 [Filimonas zeae]|uniref:Superfamily II DNA or RNA helicase, SNF2 family n=2 Tax=Filimonas zeae TaxID=1737353 RepID=A0A917IZE1_9BACT|nr:hypothetical protein GCM10011379_25330 [Filimonas zeae]